MERTSTNNNWTIERGGKIRDTGKKSWTLFNGEMSGLLLLAPLALIFAFTINKVRATYITNVLCAVWHPSMIYALPIKQW